MKCSSDNGYSRLLFKVNEDIAMLIVNARIQIIFI